MSRRCIPEDRQREIKAAATEARKRYKALRERSYRFYRSQPSVAEIEEVRAAAEAIKTEMRRYLNELNGHGPARLMDRCCDISNRTNIVLVHVRDAEDDRKFRELTKPSP